MPSLLRGAILCLCSILFWVGWGYAEKLEALADPAHEYHEEALDALGDDHDPNAQPNIDMIHASFAALAKKWVSIRRAPPCLAVGERS
jgi:hypothetical protein